MGRLDNRGRVGETAAMNVRRPTVQPLSVHEMMQRMEVQRQQEKRRAVRGLNMGAVFILGGAVSLTCLPGLRLLPWVITAPAALLMLVLAVIMLAKGGFLSGLLAMGFALLGLPLWTLMGPSMVEGVSKAGSLSAYLVQLELEKEEMHERLSRQSAERARREH